MSEQSALAAPSLVSLLVCDQVIDDRLTGKKSAIGLFNSVAVPKTPTRLHQLSVMATLTEISGKTPLRLRLMRDEDNNILMETHGHVEAPNPLTMVDLVFAMHGIPIEREGQYAFELLNEAELLGRRRFHVLVSRTPYPGQPPPPGVPGTDFGNDSGPEEI